jgi:hypothetical protein
MKFRCPDHEGGPWSVSFNAHDDPHCFVPSTSTQSNFQTYRLSDELRTWVKDNTLKEPIILAHPFGANITFYDRAEWVMFKFRFYGGQPEA